MGGVCCNFSRDLTNIQSTDELLEYIRNELSELQSMSDGLNQFNPPIKVMKMRFYLRFLKEMVQSIEIVERNSNSYKIQEIKYYFWDVFRSTHNDSEENFTSANKKLQAYLLKKTVN